ncbi:type VII secretion-associated serine protease mycosin [Streptomyces clavuligerus]|uniref:Putative secreted subtilisin-like serine protease n=1 Tax=Streptomyces clavuligerus TaxID=1901 RepID=B5H1U1_STRCL|nr:type VII secretion-associated serine protease mycosin [Streptomyces clavuligerus]ANW17776.1 type VII secretion-associated serine protease mycosin [Streptomyces clavuligerus]AXU12328.1 type VII secretion-associated serine protease mycosin [Streptomyces clavuligerus]EDY52537.1 serine protease [Streptomyces clavuligerus]EFG09689.1 Putative secreted subtilisin-like serine protease [Streptomyces clavuligerus]MBY6302207.1 type VII secretion-associated serine protease mycosin [Streptomyces clavuli
MRRRTALRAPLPAFRGLVVLAAAAVPTCVGLPLPVAVADTPGRCAYPGEVYRGRPWALQRVLLDELWKQSTGTGVRVAVIDTGVDVRHPQLRAAVDVDSGVNLMPRGLKDAHGDEIERGKEDGTTDTVGHGTKVAGIIAARPRGGTGFSGLAPGATIIPVQQNDAEGNGTAETLVEAIDHAIEQRADIINISQDTAEAVEPTPLLRRAVERAVDRGVVVVASAGNDGADGNVKKTYPASYEGVLAVASSDRDNERAAFSQSGDFVGVAAPGVDIVTTVPGGGHCADNGTSFSAPYVSAVAALLKSKHPDWEPRHIVARIQQTAERATPGYDRLVGWGVVDPVRALTGDGRRIERPSAREGPTRAEAPTPAEVHLGESAAERDARLATYAVVGTGVLVAAIGGGAVALRDARRRKARITGDFR